MELSRAHGLHIKLSKTYELALVQFDAGESSLRVSLSTGEDLWDGGVGVGCGNECTECNGGAGLKLQGNFIFTAKREN